MSRTPAPTTPPDMSEELAAHSEGYARVCGIDEAGRGPLAGPVVAAAVSLPPGYSLPGLNDSKKLTAKKREVLYSALMEDDAVQKCIAQATVQEIDELNILRATHLAMRRKPKKVISVVARKRDADVPEQSEENAEAAASEESATIEEIHDEEINDTENTGKGFMSYLKKWLGLS